MHADFFLENGHMLRQRDRKNDPNSEVNRHSPAPPTTQFMRVVNSHCSTLLKECVKFCSRVYFMYIV